MFTFVIFVLFVWTYPIYALAPEKCEKLPAQRYCMIEWMSRERWAHTERYTYNWDRRKCLLIRWAEYCGPPPPHTNNFESEHICYTECGGHALANSNGSVQVSGRRGTSLHPTMGNKVVTFTEQQLEDYQMSSGIEGGRFGDMVFKRFREVNPELVPKSMTDNEAHTIAVPVDQIEKLPELKENPFKRRICQVFSHDGSGNLTFEDFLDMMSVFSEAAPRDIKAWYAFRIYDLDDDTYIGREDLLEATQLLTKGELQQHEREEIVASVLDEADVDGDGRLSFMDFEHVVVRAPDFLSTFHIRV